jgi:septum site-determining protein MinC
MTRAQAANPSPSELPTPPKPPVAVKGREDGLHVTVTDATAPDLERSLQVQLERRASKFFSGAPVVLEMPGGALDLALAARVGAVVEHAGMRVTAVVSSGGDRPRGKPGERPADQAPFADDRALVFVGTVRSGQRVAHEGSVLVLGDVNPGGEVAAGGSVVVWGRLRGFVEAGVADGTKDAIVCALDLAPTQLRIGQALARAPEEVERTPVPEVARERDGRIVVEAWR